MKVCEHDGSVLFLGKKKKSDIVTVGFAGRL